MIQATTLTVLATRATAAGQVRTTGLIKVIGIMIMAAGPEDFAGLGRVVHLDCIAGLGEVAGPDKAAAHVSLCPYLLRSFLLKNHIFKDEIILCNISPPFC